MNHFHRPERRNRNIGTAKQGHGRNNRLVIPQPADSEQAFYERLERYRKVPRTILGKSFLFVVEETRPECVHACTVDDLTDVLARIPLEPLGELRLIVLRQPKRKEVILSSVWGRLQYGYEFEGATQPAIILEAIKPGDPFRWRKKLSLDEKAEIQRLRADGHLMHDTGRLLEWSLTIEACRSSQLYRTLLHEIGHYVDYLEKVEAPLQEVNARFAALDARTDDEALSDDHPIWDEWDRVFAERNDKWDTLWNGYWSRPTAEREVFAHRHAERLGAQLRKSGAIPFARRLDPASLQRDSLRLCDFMAR